MFSLPYYVINKYNITSYLIFKVVIINKILSNAIKNIFVAHKRHNTEKTSIIPPAISHYNIRGGDKMSRNTKSVPEAKAALDQFKYEVASEIGVPLKKGYNGDLTSAQNGSVGGYMVKKMIEAQERQMAGQMPQ